MPRSFAALRMTGVLLALALPLKAETTEEWLDRFFAPHKDRGAIAVAVVRDGQITTRAYGTDVDSVFRMASLSKVVTAYAVLQSGADLHSTIDGTPVTLHHLLTHTSGIDDAAFGNVVPLAEKITLEEHFRRRPPRFGRVPGQYVVYSNEGMTLAGYVLERTTGMPFERAIDERVFQPLGMTRSSFAQLPPFPVIPSGAEGEAFTQVPAGAMVSTAGDMAKLMLALLARDQTYGLFASDIGGYPARFHTGRSGHESVLYLIPEQRLGLFLVHTGGMDIRRTFISEFIAHFLPPRGPRPIPPPRLRSGTYRPVLFPAHRVERGATLVADTSVRAAGNRIDITFPPLALGERTTFENGRSAKGYILQGDGDRFTLTRALSEPMTFVRIPWYASGRAHLAFGAIAWLILVCAAVRGNRLALIIAALIPAAPLAFIASYLPRSAEQRPFAVDDSLRIALSFWILASILALAMPYVAWRSRKKLDAIAAVCAVLLPVVLNYWNLLGWRF